MLQVFAFTYLLQINLHLTHLSKHKSFFYYNYLYNLSKYN